ncbi:MAG: hypothetical protein FWF15_06575 [Oscillospiraceae bacterium]|nr:hypothetical protein [Oscillospiraceae bacterium]
MKKLLAASLFLILVLSVLSTAISAYPNPSNLQAYGQLHLDIYRTDTPIAIDGKNTDEKFAKYLLYEGNTSSPAIYYTSDGFGASPKEGVEALPKWTRFYMTYDDTWLYMAIVTDDPSFKSYDNWDGDYCEWGFAMDFTATDVNDAWGDRSRIAFGINGEDGEGFSDPYFYLAATYSKAGGGCEDPANYEVAVVRDEANKITIYENKVRWSEFFGTNGPVDKMFFYMQMGIGDKFIEASAYRAYMGTYRFSGSVRDAGSDTSEEFGRATIYHLANFTGQLPPEPVVEEVIDEIEESADVGTPAVTPPSGGAAQTNDMFVIFGLLAVISLAGVVVFKKKFN